MYVGRHAFIRNCYPLSTGRLCIRTISTCKQRNKKRRLPSKCAKKTTPTPTTPRIYSWNFSKKFRAISSPSSILSTFVPNPSVVGPFPPALPPIASQTAPAKSWAVVCFASSYVRRDGVSALIEIARDLLLPHLREKGNIHVQPSHPSHLRPADTPSCPSLWSGRT